MEKLDQLELQRNSSWLQFLKNRRAYFQMLLKYSEHKSYGGTENIVYCAQDLGKLENGLEELKKCIDLESERCSGK